MRESTRTNERVPERNERVSSLANPLNIAIPYLPMFHETSNRSWLKFIAILCSAARYPRLDSGARLQQFYMPLSFGAILVFLMQSQLVENKPFSPSVK